MSIDKFYKGKELLIFPMESKVSIMKVGDNYLCEYREKITSDITRQESLRLLQESFKGDEGILVVSEGQYIGFDILDKDTKPFIYALLGEYLHQLIGQTGNNLQDKIWIAGALSQMVFAIGNIKVVMDGQYSDKELIKLVKDEHKKQLSEV